ncbi:MAG: cobalamin biosynthesis protein CbiX [Haliea sp.]|nr:MAG: cobalamin biosynthesis protein CbiX [Haliea sp.]
MPPVRDAVILFGHGSRDPLWRQPIDAVAVRLRARHPGLRVECAFLELTAPDLPAVGAALAAEGARQVVIVPMFLGTGRHAREDLPLLVAQLRERHPTTQFGLQTAIGEDPRVLDLLAEIAAETL